MNRIALFLAFCIPLVSNFAMAEEPANSAVDNIGFIKKPSKQLSARFSMCNAFLNVHWIDKAKRIGYSHYDAVIKTKKRSIWALVNLDDLMPSYTLDIYKFKHKNKMRELFDLVKNGKPSYTFDTFFINGDAFYDVNNGNLLLSGNRQSVCIIYPDEQRAWIVKGKTVNHAFTELQAEELISKLNALRLPQYTPEFAAKINQSPIDMITNEKFFDRLWVLDINHDGKPDFANIAFAKDLIFYSEGNTYYRMARQDFPVDSTTWSFPPQNRTCEIKPYRHKSFLTTDGRNYFLNNQCNLTDLTSAGQSPH